MSEVNIEVLVKHLDPACRKTLENSLEMVVGLNHSAVELPHWLFQILAFEDAKWQNDLRRYFPCRAAIREQLLQVIESYPLSSNEAPTLSQTLLDACCEAWVIASLEYNAPQVSLPFVLLALLSDVSIRHGLIAACPLFANLNEALIRSDLSEQCLASEHSVNQNLNTVSPQGALNQYATNLSLLAKRGELDPVVGREREIQQMIDVLLRRRQNNPILTGEPGVGKSACVEGLAQRIAEKSTPECLHDAEIFMLDFMLLKAGASVKGEFEKRLKQVIHEVETSPTNIILFIDEAHLIIGSGDGGSSDAANILKPALARGMLRTIAATTWSEYKKYFEKDGAMVRRFQVIPILQPDVSTATDMLRKVVKRLEEHHGVLICDDAVFAASDLSDKYLSERQLPDKALSLLDTACARVACASYGKVVDLQVIESAIDKAELAKAAQNKDFSIDSSHATNWDEKINQLKKEREVIESQCQAERDVIESIKSAKNSKDKRARLEEMAQLHKSHCHIPYHVDRRQIAQVLSSWTGVPLSHMLKNAETKLLSLSSHLNNQVIGQEMAADAISRVLLSSASHLSRPNRPLGVFLLAGSSGVGKTQTAYAISEHLLGHLDQMTIINMSEFKEPHKVAMLTGSPPGYVGYGEGGVLTEAVRRTPYGLILLDEMEKAHASVQDIFYQMLDKGFMRDSEGRDIDFRQSIIVMTVNAADDYILKHENLLKAGDVGALEGLQSALEKHFKSAFLGRVTVIPFFGLSDEMMREIVVMGLNDIKLRLKSFHQADVAFDDQVIDVMVARCHFNQTGARQVASIIDQKIAPLIAAEVMSQKGNSSDLHVFVGDGGDFEVKRIDV